MPAAPTSYRSEDRLRRSPGSPALPDPESHGRVAACRWAGRLAGTPLLLSPAQSREGASELLGRGALSPARTRLGERHTGSALGVAAPRGDGCPSLPGAALSWKQLWSCHQLPASARQTGAHAKPSVTLTGPQGAHGKEAEPPPRPRWPWQLTIFTLMIFTLTISCRRHHGPEARVMVLLPLCR